MTKIPKNYSFISPVYKETDLMTKLKLIQNLFFDLGVEYRKEYKDGTKLFGEDIEFIFGCVSLLLEFREVNRHEFSCWWRSEEEILNDICPSTGVTFEEFFEELDDKSKEALFYHMDLFIE